MSGILGTLASIGMAVGPPLVYADQAFSIIRKKDSSGFSHDVCGVVLIANIIRIFFWLGNRFETPLLVQSLLLIIAHLLLLSICLHYKPSSETRTEQYAPLSPLSPIFDANTTTPEQDYEARSHQRQVQQQGEHLLPFGAGRIGKLGSNGSRPFDFWQWEGLGSYFEFMAGLILVSGVLQLILGRWMWYIDALGFIALTIESTLPIPQFISNYRRKSCYGFRSSTLAGWLFGDTFKTVYFFIRSAPIQFKVTAIMTVCWDIAVAFQRWRYGADPPIGAREEHAEEHRGLSPGL